MDDVALARDAESAGPGDTTAGDVDAAHKEHPVTTRFTDWKPVPGDAALVPGCPASASYVSVLTDDDITAIQAGHRGYAPLRFFVTAKKPTSGGRIQRGDALELVYYDAGAWQVSGVFWRWNRLDAVLSDIRREHGLKRGDYALTVLPQENL